jgi:hypothetical protein
MFDTPTTPHPGGPTAQVNSDIGYSYFSYIVAIEKVKADLRKVSGAVKLFPK